MKNEAMYRQAIEMAIGECIGKYTGGCECHMGDVKLLQVRDTLECKQGYGFDVEYCGKVSGQLRKVDGVWRDVMNDIGYTTDFESTWETILRENNYFEDTPRNYSTDY